MHNNKNKQSARKYVQNSVDKERQELKATVEKEKRMHQLLRENEALQGRLKRMRLTTKKQKQRVQAHEDFIEFLQTEEKGGKVNL